MTDLVDKYKQKGAYHWDEMERHVRTFNAVLAARYSVILSLLPRISSRILDLGCGDGYLTGAMASLGHEVTGSDPSLTALSFAREKTRQTRIQGSMTFIHHEGCQTSLPAEYFDVVVLADVIEHVESPAALLLEASRVLRPGGILLLSTPNRMPRRTWDVRHIKEYAPEEIGDLVGTAFPEYRIFIRQIDLLFRMYVLHFKGVYPFRWMVNLLALAGWNPFTVAASGGGVMKGGQIYSIGWKSHFAGTPQ